MHNEYPIDRPLDNMTIAGWERDRALADELDAITATAELPVAAEPVVECLLSELRSGFGVQLLAEPMDEGGRSWITCTLNGTSQTFEVPSAKALDAFEHPFAYGCTLPL